MDSSTLAIRVLIGSASVALIGALVVVGTLRRPNEPTATPQFKVENRSTPLQNPKRHEQHSEKPARTANQKVPEPSSTIYAFSVPTKQARPGRIENCFTSDLDVTTPASARETALVVASQKKDWSTVRQMLDGGASVESANDVG